MTTVVVAAPAVADHPRVGGHFWEYLQYVHALRQIGCDVWWLEHVSRTGDPAHGVNEDLQTRYTIFMESMHAFGLADKVILYTTPSLRSRDRNGLPWEPLTVSAVEAARIARRADVLLNFDYRIGRETLSLFRRTALIDIDPGLLQFWMHTGQLRIPPHDLYLTTGETVGAPESRFPDCGLPWTHIRPGVALDLWSPAARTDSGPFTTVSSWWGDEWIADGTDYYENNKRVTFMEFWDLPMRSAHAMELALSLGPGDAQDVSRLRSGGWRIRSAKQVAGSPLSYRSYIARSRGEFSCVKPSCIRFANRWISDRTLCYLASGKPAIVQDTGPSTFLPSGEGFLRFRAMEEAVDAVRQVSADYARHSR